MPRISVQSPGIAIDDLENVESPRRPRRSVAPLPGGLCALAPPSQNTFGLEKVHWLSLGGSRAVQKETHWKTWQKTKRAKADWRKKKSLMRTKRLLKLRLSLARTRMPTGDRF